MRYILTTVGLSSLTNGLRGVFTPKEIYNYSNMYENEIDKDFKDKFNKEFGKLINEVKNYDNKKLEDLSAELNALLKYYKDYFNKNDFHKLLVTDTYLGKKSAELVKRILEYKGFKVDIYAPKDLKTSDIESFHLSLSEIVKYLSEELEGYQTSGYKIVFNLTGGFKSVNAFIQSMASLWADESIYVFESSQELLTIPRLPLKVDEDVFKEKIDVFRLLESELDVDENKIKDIPKTLILEIGDEYSLSPWGVIVWQKIKLEIFKTLIDYEFIEYSDEFKKSFEKLNNKEKVQLNKMLDLLDKYRRTNDEKFNLRSLRYHNLNGKIAQKYSHEFYPFDGNDSKRAYCNEIGNKVRVEKLGHHLK